MELDILAIAAHPDDAELSCAGILLSHISQGYKAGILDLTRGEKGTRGTPEIRAEETKVSTNLLGLHARTNIGLDDCYFKNDMYSQLEIIKIIRHFKPKIVLINAPDDRHPDHARGSQLGYEACFYSGLRKIETTYNGINQKAHRPQSVFHYIQDKFIVPDIVVDISTFYDTKIKAIKAFKSQFFNPELNEPMTYISDEKYFSYIEARALEFGHSIGVKYGEGLLKIKQLGIKNIFQLI